MLQSGTAAGVVVHIELEAPDGIRTIEGPSDEFDVIEHGVMVGRRFLGWARVRRYWWELPSSDVGDLDPGARPMVRIVIDDGSAAGEQYEVENERFEASEHVVSFMYQDRLEPERGAVIFRRVSVPWSRVIEFERLTASTVRLAASMPARPDA